MHWIAPTAKDAASLEKRLSVIADGFSPISSLMAQEKFGANFGPIFLRLAEVSNIGGRVDHD